MTTRTALVTGATSGIGLATAQRLLDNGYDVVGTSRDPAHIPAESRLEGVRYRGLDLTDIYAIEGFVTAIGAEGIHVDVVVNNAGESQSGPLEDLPIGALERVFRLNVLGPVHLTQLLLPGMRQRGYGRVVMVGSMLASFPLAYRSSYVASKAALKGFATATRYEMAPHGVWLSTVEPGSVKTGISDRRTKYIAPDSPHDESFRTMLRVLDRDEREGIAPCARGPDDPPGHRGQGAGRAVRRGEQRLGDLRAAARTPPVDHRGSRCAQVRRAPPETVGLTRCPICPPLLVGCGWLRSPA